MFRLWQNNSHDRQILIHFELGISKLNLFADYTNSYPGLFDFYPEKKTEKTSVRAKKGPSRIAGNDPIRTIWGFGSV
jgi:hypothetical protein